MSARVTLRRVGDDYESSDGLWRVEEDWTHESGTQNWRRTGWNLFHAGSERCEAHYHTLAEARAAVQPQTEAAAPAEPAAAVEPLTDPLRAALREIVRLGKDPIRRNKPYAKWSPRADWQWTAGRMAQLAEQALEAK